MKGKLISGRLYIEKDLGNNTTSELLRMICPYAHSTKECSISCPQFGDIESGIDILDSESGNVYENGTQITICNGRVLSFYEFSVEK